MGEKIIKEYRGIRDLVAAELITDNSTTLTYGEVFPIAGVATLTRTTQNSSESHFYDNIAAIVIDSVGADEVTCEVSAIPLNVLAKLTGQYYDEVTGTFVEGESNRKYFAIGYVTEDTSGNEVYVWRHKVKCSIPDSTHNTKTDGTEANGQEIVFTGIHTTHKFTKTGKTAKAINHQASELITETAFFAEVMDIDKLNDLAPDTPSITFEDPSVILKTGDTSTLKVSIVPSTYSGGVSWSVGTGGTSYVELGQSTSSTCGITGSAEGVATITASITVNGTTYSDTCTVAVIPADE